MKLEILMSCMYQKDDMLVRVSKITGDVLVVNQCDEEAYTEFSTQDGLARMYSTKQRSLTKSRNMAVRNAKGDICLLCDDDEIFVKDYDKKIIKAYEQLPQADVIIFKMENRPSAFPDKIMRMRFPQTLHVSSWQISFRRENLLKANVFFDELLGAGTGNGAEEELKFLCDCERAGLQIYYVPVEIASVAQAESTWFKGFTEQFFENRGATTRYILGLPTAILYAFYYAVRKRKLYREQISFTGALRVMLRGILENKISKQAKLKKTGMP